MNLQDDSMMLAVLVSPLLVALLVGTALMLDRRAVRKQTKRQQRRPIVPDFTKAQR